MITDAFLRFLKGFFFFVFSFVEMKLGHHEIRLEKLLLESESKRDAKSEHKHAD